MEPCGWWSHGVGFMWTFPFFFLVVIALCVLVAMRGGWFRGGDRRDQHDSRETALEILDRRFASGEIDRTQYEQMRQALHGH